MPNLLVTSPNLPVQNLKDVFRLAKTQNLSFGTAGGGTTPQNSLFTGVIRSFF